ncbi:MAG: hypothetical protein ACPMAG_10760, partial [Limisphaerales bacterium]
MECGGKRANANAPPLCDIRKPLWENRKPLFLKSNTNRWIGLSHRFGIYSVDYLTSEVTKLW